MPSPAGDARTGPPQFQLAQALYAATPELAAPVFGMTGAELVEGLRGAGLSGAEIGRTLREIAAASGKSDAELAVAIIGLSS